jgi:hypothetical protein
LCSRDELSLSCTHSCVIVINYESTTHQAKRPTNSLSLKLLTPSISSGSPNTPSPTAFLWASSVAVFADLRVAFLRPCLIEFDSNVVSTRSIFVSRHTCRRHFRSPIFGIRDDLWSVVGRLFWCRFSLPVAFVAEIEEGGTITADHG